ncbi:MAG: hypothetical protein JWN76_560, partial [Chitinophagaceae bacterium]|nr:hypothetical protein [Chitinophagaceae bacterium]
KCIFISFLFLIAIAGANAQTFDPFSLFGKGNPLKLSGGWNSSLLYNYASHNAGGSNPFTYVIGGNLNLFFKGINIPIDVTYSNGQFSTRFQPIPFNKVAIHPHYKFVTLHAGSIALAFSPYTLNGFQFNGAGVELAPGRLKVIVLGGKFLKGSGDYNLDPEAPPTFSRFGKGLSGTYKFENLTVGVNVFHAKEAAASAFNIPVEQAVKPKENLVTSVVFNGTFFQKLNASGELANSFLTDDITSPLAYSGKKGVLGSLMHANGASANRTAMNLKMAYSLKVVNLGLSYEKVDFNYQTMGSLYTTNGFENSGITFGFPLFNGKLNMSSQVGLQNDLVDDTAFSQKSGRLSTAFNISYTPTQKLSFSASYNNNKNITNFKNLNNIATLNNIVPFYLDSLRLVQLNTNANVTANYQLLATAEENRTINAAYSFQKGDQKQGDYFVDEQGSKFQNASINLFTVYPKRQVKWNVSINYTSVIQGNANNNSTAYGVSFNFGKKFFNKTVGVTMGSGYNTTKTVADNLRVNVANFKTTVSYIYLKKHVFNLNCLFQNQAKSSIKVPASGNTTAATSLTYNYNF